MNLFNRVLLVIILSALAGLAVSVIVFAWAAPASSADALDEAVDWLQDNQGVLERTLVSTGAALVALLAITVLYLELVPRAGDDVTIIDLRTGNATLSTDAISQRVEEAVSQLRHVSDARARVEARQNGVVVDLDLHVEPEANLAAVTDAACEATRDVLANRVHVALLEPPTARLHYREARRERPPIRRPMLSAPRNGNPLTPALATAAASGAARAQYGSGNDHFESGNGRPAVIDVPRPPEAVRESPVLAQPVVPPEPDPVTASLAVEVASDEDRAQAPAVELTGAGGETRPDVAIGSDTPAEQKHPPADESPQEPSDMEPRRRI